MIWMHACTNHEVIPPTNSNKPGSPKGGLRVTVKHIYQWQPVRLDSLVSGTDVHLFRNELDRDQNLNAYNWKTTDTSGEATFLSVDTGKFYMLLIHPMLGEVKDYEYIKSNATSLLEVFYY